MCVSPVAVANWLLKLSWAENKPITQMKMQKMLYFAHGWHLALLDKPMMNEVVQAWRYGPVFESVYHTFKYFGANLIDSCSYKEREKSLFWDGDIQLDVDVHRDIIQITEEVWNVFKDSSAIQLMRLTHEKDGPWDITTRDYFINYNQLPKGLNIKDELIKNYFKRLLETNETKQ